MTHRYRIVDDEGTEVGSLLLGDGIPVGPELANARQFAAFGAKARELAALTGVPVPDLTATAKAATAEEFSLGEDASRKDWTWEQMHWCLDFLQERLDEATAPVST